MALANKIKDSFERIHASEQMKEDTYAYLLQKMNQGARHRPKPFLRPLVAICLLLFLCGALGGWHIWTTPVSYVSVDVNPSIELTLNRFDCVTHAKGQNEEGRQLLNGMKLTGKGYIEALELLLQSISMHSYLTEDAELTLTVASPKAQTLLQNIQNSAVSTQYHGNCQQADMEIVHAAHDCGMSLGKYQEYLYLSEYDETITPEDCHGMTMHQMHELLSQYENEENPSDATDNSMDNPTDNPAKEQEPTEAPSDSTPDDSPNESSTTPSSTSSSSGNSSSGYGHGHGHGHGGHHSDGHE